MSEASNNSAGPPRRTRNDRALRILSVAVILLLIVAFVPTFLQIRHDQRVVQEQLERFAGNRLEMIGQNESAVSRLVSQIDASEVSDEEKREMHRLAEVKLASIRAERAQIIKDYPNLAGAP